MASFTFSGVNLKKQRGERYAKDHPILVVRRQSRTVKALPSMAAGTPEPTLFQERPRASFSPPMPDPAREPPPKVTVAAPVEKEIVVNECIGRTDAVKSVEVRAPREWLYHAHQRAKRGRA
jgi:hypothetical protein